MDDFHQPPGNPRQYFEPMVRPKMDPSYKLDEGYSEDTRSQDDVESPIKMEPGEESLTTAPAPLGLSLQEAALGLGEVERSEIAYSVLRSLRVASIASVYDRLWHLFHKDPLMIFPAEIMAQIFSYLEPSMLLQASRASRAWRARILDSGLWKGKFKKEGWGLDLAEIEQFEKSYNQEWTRAELAKINAEVRRRNRSTGRGSGGSPLTQNDQRVRIASAAASKSEHQSPPDPDHPMSHGEQDADADEEMTDIQDEGFRRTLSHERSTSGLSHPYYPQGRRAGAGSPSISSQMASNAAGNASLQAAHLEQPLMIHSADGRSHINFHHIFKQKSKLEDNWNSGRYKSFQLPHRDHPEDAHTECVYTIQYRGNYLVSGSRDRTLRIWNLETQRLAWKPLKGHVGSVLCLQFDDRKEEDIIISGSSDTHVIIWRFSTGEMIRQLTNAHRESVLNLKFDHRFLVTCSKDKTIKIWNRHELRPGDKNYPLKGVPDGGHCPSYIIDMPSTTSPLRYVPTSQDHRMLLEPYTHLMSLDQHGAAVNAIQIYKNQLVSASGDRNLRVWNIHTGECLTKIEAHSKGIACVQYDGKRIVSGSSDNTIRIWDPVSQVEVARLEGHGRLVRTIQAAFADYPGGRERLAEEAAEVDRAWQVAKAAGAVSVHPRTGRAPRPGSRKPADLRAVGAKIPPSGGGSKWGRIVSGSYDETVIIWKKTEDDEWVIGHRLRQEEALTAAGPPLLTRVQEASNALTQAARNYTNQLRNPIPPLAPATTPNVMSPPVSHQIAQAAAHMGAGTGSPSQQSIVSEPGQNAVPAQGHRQPNIQQPTNPNNSPQVAPAPNPPAAPAPSPALQQLLQAPVTATTHPNPAPGTPPATTQYLVNHPQPNPPRPHANGHQTHSGPPNARVFKLQFDARRIICCSQDNKIVGWDFANGDDRITACSKFFAEPQ